MLKADISYMPRFPDSSVGKETACNTGDPGSIPGLGRSAGEGIGYPLQYSWAALVAQVVKNPPAMWETWVRSLGWEDPLEKRTLPTPVFWPGEFHGLYSPWGHKESDTTERLSLSLLQGIFPTQGSNSGLPHCRKILYQLSHKGSPKILEWVTYPFSSGSSQHRNRTRVSCIAGGFFTN